MAGMTSNVLAMAMVFISRAAFAADAIGQVKTETGTVRIERSGGGTLASVGDHVYQSDMIVTGSKSTVGITFADNSMMSLGPNSRLSLDQFRFDTTTQDGAFVASLRTGTLAVKSGQIVHQTPEAMHIRTPAALLGVRGTEFVVRAEGGS
jgi:hypothetical protein